MSTETKRMAYPIPGVKAEKNKAAPKEDQLVNELIHYRQHIEIMETDLLRLRSENINLKQADERNRKSLQFLKENTSSLVKTIGAIHEEKQHAEEGVELADLGALELIRAISDMEEEKRDIERTYDTLQLSTLSLIDQLDETQLQKIQAEKLVEDLKKIGLQLKHNRDLALSEKKIAQQQRD